MKIGLIGNMNNNNFALLRYFRDLGLDAYLLLYSTDGTGTLSHFTPAADSWQIEIWSPYIIETNIPNSPIAALDFPLSSIMGYKSFLRFKMGLQKEYVLPITRKDIRSAYKDYDILISSGITPATLLRINRNLDLFYPYEIKVEYLGSDSFQERIDKASFFTKFILKYIQNRQAIGVAKSNQVITFDGGVTFEELKKHGVFAKPLAIPMVYASEECVNDRVSKLLFDILESISSSKFIALHHARLLWYNRAGVLASDWQKISKNNHWVIKAFSDFVTIRKDLNPKLIIIEYGPDILETKELISTLGISESVVWLPKLSRKELLLILQKVDIGVGQFYDIPKMHWGGAGWEVIASGKPLIQGFIFEDGDFEKIYGYPPPPILKVKGEDEILQKLLYLAEHPERSVSIGKETKRWFNKYNGSSLAKQWVELLEIASQSTISRRF
jgi:hypothetical protein